MADKVKAEALKVELTKEARRLKMNFEELKSGGIIKQIQRDLFTFRLRCPGGMVSAARLRKAAELAEKYGKGQIHLSFRQSVEIPYIHYQHFDAIVQELKEIGWSLATCGPRIRVPNACAAGWLVRVGGKHGKHPMYAYEVAQFVAKEQALKLIEKTAEWYRVNAQGRERLGHTIKRLGLDRFIQEVVAPLGVETITKLEQRRKFWSEGNIYR